MKKILSGFLVLALMCSISCEKDKLDSPGNIQGMGYTPGKLQVKDSFKLPQGVYLIGDISGMDNAGQKGDGSKSVYDVKSDYSCFGSGKWVKLKMTLLNSGNYPRTIFFPKGLLWECKMSKIQHALSCQTTWICLQPNSTRSFYVDLYCINHGIPAPDHNATYRILGVTDSKVMWNLLNIIGWRKINYEMIYGTYYGGKGTNEGPTYEEITEKLQTIVWNLTNDGIDISVQDKAFIESIPELSSTEIPQLDENSQYPEYFDEFIIPGK
jgi:hypothetical protein